MANFLWIAWVPCPLRGGIILGFFGRGAKPGSPTRPDPILNQKKSSSNTRFQTSPLKSTPNFRAGLCISTPYQSLSSKPLKSVQTAQKPYTLGSHISIWLLQGNIPWGMGSEQWLEYLRWTDVVQYLKMLCKTLRCYSTPKAALCRAKSWISGKSVWRYCVQEKGEHMKVISVKA